MNDWIPGFTSSACIHEPPRDHALGWAPKYPQPIRVIDSLIETLVKERRRRRWRNIRDEALEEWGASGLKLTVERGPGIVWENGYTNPQWPSYFTKDAITFVQWPGGKALSHHLEWTDKSAGVLSLGIKEWPYWWKPYRFREIRQAVIHEFGHTLGFGHGGNGVMMGAQVPNEEELAAIKVHYGL